MILVGITGTIGSGKSFALNFFRSQKIKVFSADDEVKKILKLKTIKEKIHKIFPESFSKTKLNKNILASIVFNDKKKLKKLESIIHPTVIKKRNSFVKKNKNKKIVMMEIPIIFEKKSAKNYNYIILMTVSKVIQKQRVMRRKNMTPELLKKILSNQISSEKKKYVDFVINNNKEKKETKKILKKTLDKIISTSL
ncbi:MAG: Dephospho-CoA kinase [Alphaproteobacteria bacterium MarineAlpha6_Bin3]|nr:MAG: Dephospho-CoA kinase [Alphaproteobacteria bacterium MarineAlpha6_Bin3]|tara:strand:+ start:1700 stop:2284 length:585 start_codon:yes stop_codon:yes gene_type:complete